MKNILILLLFSPASVLAQTLVLPTDPGWTQVEEGKSLSFTVGLSTDVPVIRYLLVGENYGMKLDSAGHFSWTPSFDLVDRLAKKKEISLIFRADLNEGKYIRQSVNFIVYHVNRPPVAEELPAFYVRQNIKSTYQIPTDYVRDPDDDPIIFRARESQMPEGCTLTSQGLLTWTPSRSQFNSLKNTPQVIEFIVQDQPDKAETIGKIRVAQTQLDLPPEILLVPSDSIWTVRENEVVYFKVYVSDPNGDEDIEKVDFISSQPVPKTVLKENSIVQREFTWMPGYDFVEESEKIKEVMLTFFAFDKTNNRVQRKVRVTVTDTENVEEKDRILYQKYFNTLASARNLIDLLDKNNESLDGSYDKAKKGKKNRTVVTASLGAATGISPLVLETDPSKAVSVVGGTSVLTLNSLEAGQVIGRSANELQKKIETNRSLRTELQLRGNNFARKYALKSARRGSEFDNDRDDLIRLLNSDRLPSLELSAEPQPVPDTKSIKKIFADFSEQ